MLRTTLPSYFPWLFGVALVVYLAIMMRIGQLAQRRIHNVEDYVLAGRTLNTGFVTVAMIATWFGAESLMTTTDEVATKGMRGAMLDPLGISLCLLLAGLFVARPLWRAKLLTIPDFFRQRYGSLAETLSALVLVPSYFGWIAAQYLALGIILQQFFQLPLAMGVITVAVLATSYSLMGGMWSVMWTDTIQFVFICVGLLILGVEILWALGDGHVFVGAAELWNGTPLERWRIDGGDAQSLAPLMAAMSALAIGSLGNLPIQDLMQRICASNSEKTARRGCILGAIGYLALGCLPMLAGLSASRILPTLPNEGVLWLLSLRSYPRSSLLY
jgi:solute:Na+ symporter, SSS family